MDPTERMMARARLRRMVKTGEAKAIRQAAGVSIVDVAKAIHRDRDPSTVFRWEEGLSWPRSVTDELAWLSVLDQLAAGLDHDGSALATAGGGSGPP